MPRGKKTCPKCQELCGPRSKICKSCNHNFFKNIKPAPQNDQVRKLKIIIAPAGKPYAKLNSSKKEDVLEWYESIQTKAREHGQVMSLDACDYWIRHYFLKGKEIVLAVSHIDERIRWNQKQFMKTN